jgi:hypothetical protein
MLVMLVSFHILYSAKIKNHFKYFSANQLANPVVDITLFVKSMTSHLGFAQ